MQIFKAKRKKIIEGRDKPIWVDVAFTMLIGEYEGRTTYSLIDERTGERYNLFKWEKREDRSQRPEPNDNPVDYAAEGAQERVPF